MTTALDVSKGAYALGDHHQTPTGTRCGGTVKPNDGGAPVRCFGMQDDDGRPICDGDDIRHVRFRAKRDDPTAPRRTTKDWMETDWCTDCRAQAAHVGAWGASVGLGYEVQVIDAPMPTPDPHLCPVCLQRKSTLFLECPQAGFAGSRCSICAPAEIAKFEADGCYQVSIGHLSKYSPAYCVYPIRGSAE